MAACLQMPFSGLKWAVTSLCLSPRKQTEARHAKALEAAEEKFRKAFDRVKRAAIEAPRKHRAWQVLQSFTLCQDSKGNNCNKGNMVWQIRQIFWSGVCPGCREKFHSRKPGSRSWSTGGNAKPVSRTHVSPCFGMVWVCLKMAHKINPK